MEAGMLRCFYCHLDYLNESLRQDQAQLFESETDGSCRAETVPVRMRTGDPDNCFIYDTHSGFENKEVITSENFRVEGLKHGAQSKL